MMTYKESFIRFMVSAGVLTFGDFVTKSGRRTPYFVNTGNYHTGRQAALLGEYYAKCIVDHMKNGDIPEDVNVLFGPAYKGIPLCVSTAARLYEEYNMEISYCFNRKEVKDHGEGGRMVGAELKDGDKIIVTEDVITAGTAIRETLPLLKAQANVEVCSLIVSVDRMERGQGEKTAIQEIEEEFGIRTFPIVTVREVIDTLYQTPVDGKVVIDDGIKNRMEEYMETYCIV